MTSRGKAAARLAEKFPSSRALEVLSGLPLRSYPDNPPYFYRINVNGPAAARKLCY